MPSESRKSGTVVSKRSSLSSEDKDDDDLDDDIQLESDVFYKKWSGPVLLGPFLPAIFSGFVVIAGQLVLNTSSGTCGYDLECKYKIDYIEQLMACLTSFGW